MVRWYVNINKTVLVGAIPAGRPVRSPLYVGILRISKLGKPTEGEHTMSFNITNTHERDALIQFDAAEHKYWINGIEARCSVTGLHGYSINGVLDA